MMNFTSGDAVVLLPPFNVHFSGVQIIAGTGAADDGQPVVYLEGIESAFSPVFLQRAE